MSELVCQCCGYVGPPSFSKCRCCGSQMRDLIHDRIEAAERLREKSTELANVIEYLTKEKS